MIRSGTGFFACERCKHNYYGTIHYDMCEECWHLVWDARYRNTVIPVGWDADTKDLMGIKPTYNIVEAKIPPNQVLGGKHGKK